jgi:hypothetical protein
MEPGCLGVFAFRDVPGNPNRREMIVWKFGRKTWTQVHPLAEPVLRACLRLALIRECSDLSLQVRRFAVSHTLIRSGWGHLLRPPITYIGPEQSYKSEPPKRKGINMSRFWCETSEGWDELPFHLGLYGETSDLACSARGSGVRELEFFVPDEQRQEVISHLETMGWSYVMEQEDE